MDFQQSDPIVHLGRDVAKQFEREDFIADIARFFYVLEMESKEGGWDEDIDNAIRNIYERLGDNPETYGKKIREILGGIA